MKLSKTILFAFLTCGIISCNGEASSSDETPTEKEVEASSDSENLEKKVFVIDSEKSTINWKGSKPTEAHFGTIKILPAILELKGNVIVGGDIVIDMNTIEVTDIEDPQANAKLVKHLKNKDFFNVEEFPVAQFNFNPGNPEDSSNVSLNGDLVIKGIANNADIQYNIENVNDTTVINGAHTFDRTKYDIKYKSNTVFGDLGDKFIHDEIELEFSIYLIEEKLK